MHCSAGRVDGIDPHRATDLVVARVGIATLPQRLGASAVVVVGIAGVVGVLVALLAMGAGFESTLRQTGTDDSAIVMQAGAHSELNSAVTPETVALVSQAPQVLKNAEGRSIASPELVVTAMLQNKSGHDANVVIRGVGRACLGLVASREDHGGSQVHSWAAGADRRARASTPVRGNPDRIHVDAQWSALGRGGNLRLRAMPTAPRSGLIRMWLARRSSVGRSKTSLTVQLTDAHALDAFKARLASDPRLKVEVQTHAAILRPAIRLPSRGSFVFSARRSEPSWRLAPFSGC